MQSKLAFDITASLAEIVVEVARNEPTPMSAIYEAVLAFRPDTAKETIRARVYEQMANGRMTRIAKGVYLAVDGPSRLLLVEGDAWEVLKGIPDESVNVTISDVPFDLGTAQNAKIGTTRPHKDQGRTYEQKDLDLDILRELYRVTSKSHAWSSVAPRTCASCGEKVDKKSFDTPRLNEATSAHCPSCNVRVALAPQKMPCGGGAAFILTPPRTEQTDVHIDNLKRLAKEVGFEFQAEFAIQYDPKGMGYWPPQQHWLMHFFTAGKRAGVPHDLSVTSSFTVDRVRRVSKADAEEHEAEKPTDIYDRFIRFASRPGDVIMDMFAGRARWARKAVCDGRHVILVEKDPVWVERIRNQDWLPA